LAFGRRGIDAVRSIREHVCTWPWFPILAVALLPAVARADALDVGGFVLRYRGDNAFPVILLKCAGLLVLNYAANLVVIGLPAILWQRRAKGTVAKDLIWLTLLGQVADRIGAVAALVVVLCCGGVPLSLEEAAIAAVIATFVVSAVAVYLLTFHFAHRRWKIEKRPGSYISTATAILCNPAWSLFLMSL
jgi:hypothetical protein